MKVDTECSFCKKQLRRNAGFSAYFCNFHCKAEWQKLQRPVTVEWLKQKYLTEKLDCSQIGKIVHRDPKSVWNWLKGSGIQTRPRGGPNAKGHIGYWRGKKLPKKTRDAIRAARLRDGRCPAFVNGKHWLHVYKNRKPASWKGGITPERQAFYASQEWKDAVRVVRQRDQSTCQRCHKKQRALDIHHIASFAVRELRAEPSNLVLLCEPCHYWVHSNKNKKKLFLK